MVDNFWMLISLKYIWNHKGKTIRRSNKSVFFSHQPFRIQIKLTNLFNGDKALGSNLNIFLNENWKDVWTELQPAFHSTIAEIMKSVMKNIFNKFSYNELFLE